MANVGGVDKNIRIAVGVVLVVLAVLVAITAVREV